MSNLPSIKTLLSIDIILSLIPLELSVPHVLLFIIDIFYLSGEPVSPHLICRGSGYVGLVRIGRPHLHEPTRQLLGIGGVGWP